MKNPIHNLLLDLLGRYLNQANQPDNEEEIPSIGHPSDDQWKALIALADQMQISGLLYDAVTRLGANQRPTQETLLQWTARVVEVERNNVAYRHQLYAMLDQMTLQHMTPIVMKGITIANLYPNALRRPVGDVDLFVPLDAQPGYIKLFEKAGAHFSTAYDLKHLSVLCLDMHWELHFRSLHFYNSRSESRYRLLEAEETAKDALFHENYDGHQVAVFPPLLNMVYLTAHLQHHLLMEKATLRQIVDWMFALKHDRTALAIKEAAFVNQLRRLGLFRLYRAIGYIAITYLGLNAESYAGLTHLSKLDKKRGEYLLKIILKGHVPGGKPFIAWKDTDSFWQRVDHFIELVKRCLALRGICWRESWATPFGFLYHAIRRRLK